MKYLSFLAVSISVFALLACGHGRPYDETGTSETQPAILPASSSNPSQTIPLTLDRNNIATTPLTITPSGTATAGLNPAHGQPGHRCDIAVGAPLNSAPAQQNTSAVSTPVNISTDNSSQTSTTTVAPGMNPAHGQPGHRCDIAVGAPLNSQPTTAITKQTNQIVQPVATTKTAPGMNPPHGEPGHRCDIAVGEPLSTPMNPNYTPPAANKQVLPQIIPVKPLPDSSGKNR
jgi:hypothetical protein